MSTDGAIDLLQAHVYYYQFGNIRIASKSSDKFYRLDAAAIVLLSQIVYWHPKARKHDYWIYKTQEEFSQETALSCKQIARARNDLVELGLLKYKLEGYPPKAYFKLNTSMLDKYANALAEKQDEKDPTVYISVDELEALSLCMEEDSPKPDKKVNIEIPDDWFSIFARVRECGFYQDKADKDPNGVLYGYNEKLYTYVSEILDGTFYEKSGKNITNRHDTSGLTRDIIIDWLVGANRLPAGRDGYANRAILYLTKTATYSPMLNALCGKATPAKTKPKSFYEADKPSNAPDWIWEAHQLPSLYPEIQQDDRKFWGFYVNAIEYINDCQKKEDMDRNNWGMWTKLNNGLTNPPNNLFMDIFRAAKKAEMGVEEIYSLKFGDVNNFLWILTAREMKQNHSIKILPDGKDYSYVYGDGPLNRAKYERRN